LGWAQFPRQLHWPSPTLFKKSSGTNCTSLSYMDGETASNGTEWQLGGILEAVTMSTVVFCTVTQRRRPPILKMEAGCTSETLVATYKTTRYVTTPKSTYDTKVSAFSTQIRQLLS